MKTRPFHTTFRHICAECVERKLPVAPRNNAVNKSTLDSILRGYASVPAIAITSPRTTLGQLGLDQYENHGCSPMHNLQLVQLLCFKLLRKVSPDIGAIVKIIVDSAYGDREIHRAVDIHMAVIHITNRFKRECARELTHTWAQWGCNGEPIRISANKIGRAHV